MKNQRTALLFMSLVVAPFGQLEAASIATFELNGTWTNYDSALSEPPYGSSAPITELYSWVPTPELSFTTFSLTDLQSKLQLINDYLNPPILGGIFSYDLTWTA